MATAATKSKTASKSGTKSTTKKAPVPASDNAPRHQVVENTFIWPDTEQGDIRIPLRFKMKLLRKVNAMKDADEIDQLFMLLDGLGDTRSQEQIDEMDVFDAKDLIEAYFEEFEAKNEARMGESRRSSK